MGWYEGEKRLHRHFYADVTFVAQHDVVQPTQGGRLMIDVYDDFLAYMGAPVSRMASLFYGVDFPRRRVLKPNNEPVALSGTLLACDLVVGNKLVIKEGEPPIVLLVGPPSHEYVFRERSPKQCALWTAKPHRTSCPARPPSRCRLEMARIKGVHFAPQPPDIGFDDEGVPEWPSLDEAGNYVVAAAEEGAGEPEAVPQQGTSRSSGASDPAAGAGAAGGGAVGADPE